MDVDQTTVNVDQSIVAEIEDAIDQSIKAQTEVAAGGDGDNGKVTQVSAADGDDEGKTEGQVDNDSNESTSESEVSKEVVIEKSAQEQVITPSINDALIERAVRAGLSFGEALGFSDEKSLSAVVGALERKVQVDAELAKAKTETKQEDDTLDLFAKLNKEDFEPEVVQLLETLAGQVKAQRDEIRALKSTSEQSAAAAQQVAVREVEDWFDKQISGLGEDYANILGTGGYRTLAPGSAQLAKRDALAGQMAILLAGYQTIGRQAPSREDVFNSALKMVLGDEIAKMSQRKVEEKLRRSAGQHIQRTGGKSEKTPGGGDPEAEVAALINEKFFGKEEAR